VSAGDIVKLFNEHPEAGARAYDAGTGQVALSRIVEE